MMPQRESAVNRRVGPIMTTRLCADPADDLSGCGQNEMPIAAAIYPLFDPTLTGVGKGTRPVATAGAARSQ